MKVEVNSSGRPGGDDTGLLPTQLMLQLSISVFCGHITSFDPLPDPIFTGFSLPDPISTGSSLPDPIFTGSSLPDPLPDPMLTGVSVSDPLPEPMSTGVSPSDPDPISTGVSPSSGSSTASHSDCEYKESAKQYCTPS